MANISPNRFVMQSSDGTTKLDYETTSFAGQPVLNLTQGPGGPIRHFAGSQIRTLNTEIGTLVSVTTQMTVDTGSTSFSVLIPAVTLTSISDHKTFSTEVDHYPPHRSELGSVNRCPRNLQIHSAVRCSQLRVRACRTAAR